MNQSKNSSDLIGSWFNWLNGVLNLNLPSRLEGQKMGLLNLSGERFFEAQGRHQNRWA